MDLRQSNLNLDRAKDNAFSHSTAFNLEALSNQAFSVKCWHTGQFPTLRASPKHRRQSSCSSLCVIFISHLEHFLNSAMDAMTRDQKHDRESLLYTGTCLPQDKTPKYVNSLKEKNDSDLSTMTTNINRAH